MPLPIKILLLFPLATLAHTQSPTDSLSLRLLLLDIAAAEVDIRETDLWHRLIPRVSLTASFGVRDLVFFDPSTASPYLIPRDSYRLTASFTLGDITDGSRHERAMIRRRVLETRLQQFFQQDEMANLERADLLEELRLTEELVQFHEMLYEDGKIQFDAAARMIAEMYDKQYDELEKSGVLGKVEEAYCRLKR